MWEGRRRARVCTGGPVSAVCRVNDRWRWGRVEYRGGWRGGECVEWILEGRASAIGLL